MMEKMLDESVAMLSKLGEEGYLHREAAIYIDELEEKTDIDFFHNLPDNIEDNVEKSYSLNDWNWK